MKARNKISRAMLLTLTAMSFGAFWIVLTRYALVSGENPLNFTLWVGMFTLVPWCFLFNKHKRSFFQLSQRMKFYLIGLGIAGSIGVNFLQSLALAHTTAVNFSFIYRLVVVFTILFAWLFFKEKITLGKGILVILIVIGSYLVTSKGEGLSFTQGDLYSVLMAASAALIANILIKHTISKMHPDLSGSVTMIVGCFSLLILALISGVFAIPHNLFLIFLGSVFYFGLIRFRNRSYQVASASFVTMVFSLSPLLVTVLSFFVLHETLSPIQLFGGMLIVGATLFLDRLKI